MIIVIEIRIIIYIIEIINIIVIIIFNINILIENKWNSENSKRKILIF